MGGIPTAVQHPMNERTVEDVASVWISDDVEIWLLHVRILATFGVDNLPPSGEVMSSKLVRMITLPARLSQRQGYKMCFQLTFGSIVRDARTGQPVPQDLRSTTNAR